MNYRVCVCEGYASKKGHCFNLVKPFKWLCSTCWNAFNTAHGD